MSLNLLNYEYEWTAIVALIAAGIALYGSWRANKIAEKNLSLAAELEIIKFREKWLQDLRHEMAVFSGITARESTLSEDEWVKACSHMSKILLLMNSADEDYDELKGLTLDLLRNATKEGLVVDGNTLKYFDICQKVLKREWEKIKEDLRNYNAKNK